MKGRGEEMRRGGGSEGAEGGSERGRKKDETERCRRKRGEEGKRREEERDWTSPQGTGGTGHHPKGLDITPRDWRSIVTHLSQWRSLY